MTRKCYWKEESIIVALATWIGQLHIFLWLLKCRRPRRQMSGVLYEAALLPHNRHPKWESQEGNWFRLTMFGQTGWDGGHRWRVIVCVLPSGHLTKSPPPSGWPPLTPPRHPQPTVGKKNLHLKSSRWEATPARLLPTPWKGSTAKFSLVYATPSLLCRSQSPAPAVLPAPQFTE